MYSDLRSDEQPLCLKPVEDTGKWAGGILGFGRRPWEESYTRKERTCPELAYNHCLHRMRGRTKWLLLLRAPDKYLSSSLGRGTLRQLMGHTAGEKTAIVHMVAHHFGERATPG